MGEEQQGVTVGDPVIAEVFDHEGGQRHHPVVVVLAVADPEFIFVTKDVVDGEGEAFAKAQPATIDEF